MFILWLTRQGNLFEILQKLCDSSESNFEIYMHKKWVSGLIFPLNWFEYFYSFIKYIYFDQTNVKLENIHYSLSFIVIDQNLFKKFKKICQTLSIIDKQKASKAKRHNNNAI